MKRNHANTFSYETKDRSTVWELFHPASSPVHDVSVAEALVEPGKETELHRHKRSQEIYYIIEGSGEMKLGKETFAVEKYDAILIPPNTAHRIKNHGETGIRILCICSPPYSHEDTILE